MGSHSKHSSIILKFTLKHIFFSLQSLFTLYAIYIVIGHTVVVIQIHSLNGFHSLLRENESNELIHLTPLTYSYFSSEIFLLII